MEMRQPNEAQMSVINELDHNLILFASAGTGKTFTVAHRVRKVIETERARPEEILCLTFTIKAANEMKEDILQYVGEAGNSVETRTIHSFAYHVLKEESVLDSEFYGSPRVCDEVETAELLRKMAVETGLSETAPILKSTHALTAFLSALKHEREILDLYGADETADFEQVYRQIRAKDPQQLDRMLMFYDYDQRREIQDAEFNKLMNSSVGEFLHRYNQALRESDLLDFDDLICLTHRLFRNPEALARWQGRYRYITIDEMQDTSVLEFDTLRNLFGNVNVMMCGDFFQTIYQWRGSNPEQVLNTFIRDYQARTFMFAENYRSTRVLTAASFGYLQRMYPDLMGRYCPPNVIPRSPLEGTPILNVRVPSLQEEARFIYRYFEQHRPEDVTRVCIMARSNPYIARLYDELAKISADRADGHELRFFSVDKDAKFFRREVIRDILSFYRILVNPTDAIGFERVVRKYVSGVGEKSIQLIREMSTLGLSLASFADEKLYRDGDPYRALIDAFRAGNVVIYDTETTGLDLHRDQIIQISAIRLGPDGQVTDTLDQMVIPTVAISAGARATHHQTMEEIVRRGGTDIKSALERFLAFCQGTVLVGHNSLRFDAPLIRRQLRENGLPMPKIAAEYDTLPIAQQFLPKSVNYKLGTLCDKFGIVNEAAHDALGDITATGKVLACLLEQFIIPQTGERASFLQEWGPKFRKIYGFLAELRRDYVEKNDVYGLTEKIIHTLDLRTRYKGTMPRRTLDDFLFSLRPVKTEDAESFLSDLLVDAALSGSQMDLLIRKLGKIPIITVHQSKGCEFDTVILAGADDDNFPTFQAKIHHTEEEEKRVFYVAISRARRTLIMTSVTQKENRAGVWPLSQSRYISGIPQELIRTQFGSQIRSGSEK